MRSLASGTLIDRYELVVPVGDGGMAQVWVARQKGKHGFAKLFALKCIHARFADVAAFRSMFLDEARIASSIEHPNVAQIFDLGESETMLYLVMEYVDGESLSALIEAASSRAKQSAIVPTAVALRIIADACAGLHAAHVLKDAHGNPRGVVHRDVSPQNILVSVKGDVKLIDFGIAHAKDRIGGDTAGGAIKGKLHYMAPEQAKQGEIGPYTDVFAIGATLYRMLAGRPPFESGTDAATLLLLLSNAPLPPLPEHVPPLICAIVERALSRDPGDRYASALAMMTAIEHAIVEEGYVPDVATWVAENTSEATRERRVQLATRTGDIRAAAPDAASRAPAFSADLGPTPGRPAPRPPLQSDAPDARLEPELSAPGLMDVSALVARAGAPPPPERAWRRAAAAIRGSVRPSGGAAGGPAEAAPPDDVPRVGPTTKAAPERASPGAGGWTTLAVGTAALVLVIAGVLLLLPMIVRDRVLASAREAGVDLSIDRVSVGAAGVTLSGVTAKLQRVRGAALSAEEVFAPGLSTREVRVRGLEVRLDGAATEIGPALYHFYEESRGRVAGGSTDPHKISVVSAHVRWSGLLGEGTWLDARDVGTELESRGVGAEDVRANVGTFEVKTKHALVGPWGGAFEGNPASSRLRVIFDPPVTDGPRAMLVWDKASPPHLTVNIARSPLARLGLRLGDLGLPPDDRTELEVKLEGGQNSTMRIEGTGRIDLFGVRLKSLKSTLDITVEGTASGLPGKPLDLQKTTATLGPFLANVTGVIAPTDLGFRLDAAWRTQPISCEKLARAEAKSLGPVAAALQDLARATGAARVTGAASATGLVQYDTKTPDEVAATVATRETCGLSIFGM